MRVVTLTPDGFMQYQNRKQPLAIITLTIFAAIGCADTDDDEREPPLATSPPTDVSTVAVTENPLATAPDAGLQVADSTPDATARGPWLGTFEFTYYWVASERRGAAPSVQLYNRHCRRLAKVPSSFAKALAMEGTGRLRDGRVINRAGNCKCGRQECYFVSRARWGTGVAYRPLSPFRSVAVDTKKVKIGTTLYIPELDGLTMPGRKPWGGFVHDGCVMADDRGGNINGAQLDFFSARYNHYKALFGRHRLQRVSVFEGTGRCEKKGRSVVAAHRNSI